MARGPQDPVGPGFEERMADQEAIARLRQGTDAWNEWRRAKGPATSIDLTGGHLSDVNLPQVDLSFADLSGAQLSDALMTGATLRGACLIGANLDGTRLERADLERADLSWSSLALTNLRTASLREAELTFALLRDTRLEGADFTAAAVGNTSFSNLDLRGVHGLNVLRHRGPSTVGVDTLHRSGGEIPEIFLRGCGVPDEFITYLPSLIGAEQAVRFYSCFISYSTQDEAFAKRLSARMREEGLRVWFAPEDIQGGRKLHEQIDRAIEMHDRLLVVLSEHSLGSEWVMTEIRRARRQERREQRRKLFPIRLCSFDMLRSWECFDADSGKDLGVEVREYYVPDFTHWNDDDAFETAFARLLRDLRDEEQAQA
jgi:uncharacterized protein YjbI with pentapeptide repeats